MKALESENDSAPGVSLVTAGDATVVQLSGGWRLQKSIASANKLEQVLATSQIRSVRFDGQALSSWDSSILIFLTKVTALCRQQNIATDRAGLPGGIRRLLELAEVAPERKVEVAPPEVQRMRGP